MSQKHRIRRLVKLYRLEKNRADCFRQYIVNSVVDAWYSSTCDAPTIEAVELTPEDAKNGVVTFAITIDPHSVAHEIVERIEEQEP